MPGQPTWRRFLTRGWITLAVGLVLLGVAWWLDVIWYGVLFVFLIGTLVLAIDWFVSMWNRASKGEPFEP